MNTNTIPQRLREIAAHLVDLACGGPDDRASLLYAIAAELEAPDAVPAQENRHGSVALQYLREEVARAMAPVHAAFDERSKAEKPAVDAVPVVAHLSTDKTKCFFDATIQARGGLAVWPEYTRPLVYQHDHLAAVAALQKKIDAAKPLDDPRLQELFGCAIDGALTSGYQGVAPAPEGHWLKPWWDRGRAVAEHEHELKSRIDDLEADLQFRREFQHGAEALAGKYLTQRDDARDRIASLAGENFSLAAGQCIVPGGLCGDESGNQYCSLQARIDELEARQVPEGWVAVPIQMTPEQMRAVQMQSEIGSHIASNWSGAYSCFQEFWAVALAAIKPGKKPADPQQDTSKEQP